MNTDLARIACGQTDGEQGELIEILDHLGSSIDLLFGQLKWIAEGDENRMTVFGPFIGRSVLEISLTAIVARLDPFRVLYIREMQRQPGFDISIRRAASIQWQGDVLAKDKPPADLWDPNRQFDKVTRALLADYYENIFWKSAFLHTLDALSEQADGEWLTELRSIEPDQFGARMRADFGKLYSALSKGIHHEFVIPPAALYDRNTVVSLLEDALRLTAHMSIVSHSIFHCPFNLTREDALACYIQLQSFEVA